MSIDIKLRKNKYQTNYFVYKKLYFLSVKKSMVEEFLL